MKKELRSISLVYALAVPILALASAATILVTALSLRAGARTAETVVSHLGADIAGDVRESLAEVFSVPLRLNASNYGAVRSGALNMADASVRDRFFARQLEAFPQVSYSYYGREDGSFYGARRNEAGEIETIHNDAGTKGSSLYFSIDGEGNPVALTAEIKNFDCRTRPWYRAGLAAGGPAYSEIYRHFVYRDLAVTAALPVPNRAGGWEGVLGVDYRLDRINGFLKELAPVPGAAIVVVERKTGYLVGNSLGLPNYREDGGQFVRLKTADLGVPALPGDRIAALTGDGAQLEDSSFSTGTERMRLASGRVGDYGLDWLVFVSLPYRAYTSEIESAARTTFILGGLFTLLLVVLIPLLTRRLLRPIEQVVAAANRIAGGDWDFRAPEGTYRETGRLAESFNSMAARLKESIGGLEAAVADRTRELETKNRELSESNSTKDTFFAILAHDLRGTVGSIAEMLTAIDNGTIVFCEDDAATMNHELAEASRSVAQLLENLLVWASSQRGEIAYNPEPTDLGVLITDAIGVVAPGAAGKRIRISYGGGAVPVRCDPNMVRTVLRNLLSNAVKFTPPEGRVEVAVSAAADRVRVSVKDTGVGMDSATLDSLFGRGRAPRRTGTAGEKGSGLGLRLCRDFVQRHGGSIEVQSEAGAGSVFSFTLPG